MRGRVIRTPVVRSLPLDRTTGGTVVAKAEGLQRTGSFKVRGAMNKIRTLSDAERSAGLITISAGNAALGAAHAASEFGADLTVVMPERAVREKVEAVTAYGCRVVQDGVTNATVAFERAAELQDEGGLTLVHPFDDPMVVAGAATLTMEFLEDCPDLDTLWVPCSGGGMISGAILAARTMGSSVRIVGVQPEGADGIVRSLAAGRRVPPPEIKTVADGLTAPMPGAVNLAMISEAAVDVVTVSEDQILPAMRTLVTELRLVVEPSAAVPLAGLLAHPELRGPGTAGLVLSGSNTDWHLLSWLLS